MFGWLGRRQGTKKPEPEKQVEKQKTPASVRLVLKKAVADAEQIVTSIKMKAQMEAEEEAARIIAQANQEAEEIKRRAEAAAAEKAKDILPAADRKVKKPRRQVIEERVEEPVQLNEAAVVSEPVMAVTKEPLAQPLPERKADSRESESGLPEQDISQTTYTGEVELAIGTPVDLKMVSKLYNNLQTIPELRILHTRGSVNQGTTVTVVLEKPTPLVSMILSRMPEVEAVPEPAGKDSLAKGKSSSLSRKSEDKVRRIRLALKRSV